MAGNIELIQGIYAAFGRGDVAAIQAVNTDDTVWTVIGSSSYPLHRSFNGKAGIMEFFVQVAQHEDFSELAPRSFHDAGDHVFVIGHAAYTLKTTGEAVDTDFVHVWGVADGKVSSFREFADTAQVVAGFAAERATA